MSTHELLSRNSLLEEEFNAKMLETGNIQEFLLYFGMILQLGVYANLISQEDRNRISNYITQAAIQEIVGDDDDEDEFIETPDRQLANYMYVITIYLQNQSNWQAWLELSPINSISKARDFVQKVREWMIQNLKKLLMLLKTIQTKVVSIGASNINDAYNELVRFIDKFTHFSSINSTLELKLEHNGFGLTDYIFLNSPVNNTKNLYDKLCGIIDCFIVEIGILSKINAKTIIKFKADEVKEAELHRLDGMVQINNLYHLQMDTLIKEKEYKLDYYYKTLNRPGRKKKGCNDEIAIRQEYRKKINDLQSEWDAALKSLERKQDKDDEIQAELLGEKYFLIDIVKEYALYGLSQKGIIEYPKTIHDRAILYSHLKLSPAITEFIEMNRDKLTDTEIVYLESCKIDYEVK